MNAVRLSEEGDAGLLRVGFILEEKDRIIIPWLSEHLPENAEVVHTSVYIAPDVAPEMLRRGVDTVVVSESVPAAGGINFLGLIRELRRSGVRVVAILRSRQQPDTLLSMLVALGVYDFTFIEDDTRNLNHILSLLINPRPLADVEHYLVLPSEGSADTAVGLNRVVVEKPVMAEAPGLREIIVIVGPRGGSTGKTFVAAGLAAAYAGRQARVALLDLDTEGGLSKWFNLNVLDTKHDHQLREFLDAPQARLNRYTLANLQGVWFFGSTFQQEPTTVIDSEELLALTDALRAEAHCLIIDTGRHLDAGAIAALRLATRVLLVVTMDWRVCSEALSLIAEFEAMGFRKKTEVVVNRSVQCRKVDPINLSRTLDHLPLAGTIPPADAAAADALDACTAPQRVRGADENLELAFDRLLPTYLQGTAQRESVSRSLLRPRGGRR